MVLLISIIMCLIIIAHVQCGTIGTDNANCDRCSNCAPDAIIAPGKTTIYNEGNAFAGCQGLLSIIIENDVTGINYRAFKNADNLHTVTIGDGVQYISAEMFAGCNLLSSVYIGSGITSISNEAFASCPSLYNLNIPSWITHIGNSAFTNCKLSSITLGANITSIGTDAFSNCNNLVDVTIVSFNTNHNITLGNIEFGGCTDDITTLTILNSDSGIGKDVHIICSTGAPSAIPTQAPTVKPLKFHFRDHIHENGDEILTYFRNVRTAMQNGIGNLKKAIQPRGYDL